VQFTLQGFETADNLSRVIEISLMASGDTVDFPLEKIVASMYVTTPSASTPSINACTIKDNKIIYEVLPITEEGTTIMQLKIAETSITGAKSILATPKFAVEVSKSNADDESAEQTTTFTALENATTKANAVYNSRLLKVEVTDDLTFRAIYADGTEYESTAIREGISSTVLTPKGEYDANTQYEPFDIVIDNDKAYLAIKSSVGVATSNITTYKSDSSTMCQCTVRYISTEEKDFDGSVYGSYRKTIHKSDSKLKEVIEYVNSLLLEEDMPMSEIKQENNKKYQEHIDMLQQVHNLVLTGAPGTGKTYMAQAIAEEMKAVTKFVQFHPSYDYTDFVEGLRPIEKSDGQMGFERKDGVFKEFCKEAIKNLIDSEKSIENLTKEMSWQENKY
jgi:hypothetical protein